MAGKSRERAAGRARDPVRPAGVGVIQNLGVLGEYGAALAAALLVSTVLTLGVTVWVFAGVSRLLERDG